MKHNALTALCPYAFSFVLPVLAGACVGPARTAASIPTADLIQPAI